MDEREFKHWLKGKPASWASLIAARLALRVLPIALSMERLSDPDFRSVIALYSFRASGASWLISYNNFENDLINAAIVVRSKPLEYLTGFPSPAVVAARAGIHCAIVAAGAGSAEAASRAVEAVARCAYASLLADENEIWAEIASDVRILSKPSEGEKSAKQSLGRSQLWALPTRTSLRLWNEAKSGLLRTVAKEEARGMGPHLDGAERRRLKELEAEDWGVWTEWYDRRLRGDPPNEALEIERVTSPAIPWDEGPRAVNKALREIEEKHARKPPCAELVRPQALRLAAMPALAETTAEGLARQIEDWISACMRESEANALPDELLALEALPAILRRLSKAVHSEGGTEALEATIAAMAVEIARLKADLALAKNAPRESLFWTSFRKKAGESLGDWKMWGALASGGYLLLGPQISSGALSDLIAMIRPSAP